MANSSAARAWNSAEYSTTGGHARNVPPSEPTVAQPVSKLVTIARTTRRRLERHRVVVRHCDVESRAVHVLRAGCAAHSAVVLRTAIGGTDDQRLPQPLERATLKCDFY